MTRDEVLGVIKHNLSEIVEGVSLDDLDATKSMRDVGATSLDVVEVASASMRDLKVKVPRAELNDIRNIDGLVDALYAALQSQGRAN